MVIIILYILSQQMVRMEAYFQNILPANLPRMKIHLLALAIILSLTGCSYNQLEIPNKLKIQSISVLQDRSVSGLEITPEGKVKLDGASNQAKVELLNKLVDKIP